MMSRCYAIAFIVGLLPCLASARDVDLASWQNLRQLTAGMRIEVSRKQAEPVKGTFTGVSDDSVTLLSKQREVAIQKTDVTRVLLRGRGRGKWYGVGIGTVGGAVAGAVFGARLANESAGDIDIRAASTGVLAGAGALIGGLVGASLDARHSTIYVAK